MPSLPQQIAEALRAKFFKESGLYLLATIVPKAAAFLLLPVWTHYMAPAEFGIYSTAMGVAMLLGVLIWCGIPSALGRFYIDLESDQARFRRFFTSNAVTVLVFGAALIGIAMLYGEPLWGALDQKEILFSPYVQLALAVAFCGFGTAVLVPVYRMQRRAVMVVVLRLAPFFIGLSVGIWLVVVSGQGARGRLTGELVASGCGLVIGIFLICRFWLSRSWSWADVKQGLVFGLPLLPHTASLWILNTSNRVLIGKFGTAADVGLFSLAVQLSLLLTVFQNALNNSWSPVFMRLMRGRDKSDPHAPVAAFGVVWVAAMGLLAAAVVLFAEEIIGVMSARSYDGAQRYVGPIVLGFFCLGLYFPGVNLLIYHKKHRIIPFFTAAAAGVNLLSNLYFIPIFGAVAAAYNGVVSYGLLCVLIHLGSSRIERIPYAYRKIFLMLAVVFASLPLALLLPSGLAGTSLKIIVFAAIAGGFATLARPQIRTLQELNHSRSA